MNNAKQNNSARTALPIAFACLALVAASCGQKESLSRLALPESTRISTEGRFALVSDPYVSLRDIPGPAGITVSHARRGDVLPVKGRKLLSDGPSAVVWLDLGTGWVIDSSVQLYSNKSRAMSASRLIEADSAPSE